MTTLFFLFTLLGLASAVVVNELTYDNTNHESLSEYEYIVVHFHDELT